MKKHPGKTALALLLAVLLMVGAFPLSAFAVTQAEIDALQEVRDGIDQQRAAQQAVVDALEERQASVLEQKQALDERNAFTQKQIAVTEQQIALYNEMIEEKAQEVDEALSREQEQLDRYRSRVRAMEESGGYNFLALLLNASSFGELLTVLDDIGRIMQSDRQLEDEYIAAREHTEQVKAEYEQVKGSLEERKVALEDEKAEYESQIEEATAVLNRLMAEIEENEAALKELSDMVDETQHRIDVLVDQLEAERAAEEEARRQQEQEQRRQEEQFSGNGSWIWPTPGCYYITSNEGYRYHPISGEWKYHSGTDIGASYGSTVIATAGGTVCLCEYYGGYGYCVMIDHHNGYYSLYGHLSAFAVSDGQSVSAGQTIAYVGSTGYSTGPHLHFEIRYGSECLDPIEVGGFTGLTYAPDAGE